MVLRGRGEDGRFLTAQKKVYPSEMCRIFAEEIVLTIRGALRAPHDSSCAANLRDAIPDNMKHLYVPFDSYFEEHIVEVGGDGLVQQPDFCPNVDMTRAFWARP